MPKNRETTPLGEPIIKVVYNNITTLIPQSSLETFKDIEGESNISGESVAIFSETETGVLLTKKLK